jgi:hypothetical protein
MSYYMDFCTIVWGDSFVVIGGIVDCLNFLFKIINICGTQVVIIYYNMEGNLIQIIKTLAWVKNIMDPLMI